jgi:hyperosmotically inducible periplasmic protein
MLNLKKIVLVSGMSAIVALTGCEMMNHHSGDRTAGRALDDKTITATVKHDLNREPVYKFTDVDVKTFDGVVQLSGFVSTEEQKRRAGDIAHQAEGVTQVVNNITLKPSGNDNLAPTSRPNENNNNNNTYNNSSSVR